MVLWAAYLLALPFQRVWVLPWLGAKLQPPEVVFVALAAVSAWMWLQGRLQWRFAVADAAAAAWLAANLIALAWSSEPQGRDGLIETLGAAYVVSLYAVVRATATPQLLDRFGEWFAYSAAVAAVLGITGSVASLAGLPNQLATIVSLTLVPYLGHAARAQAFTAGPQMLASILLVAIPLFVAARMKAGWRRRDQVLVLVVVVGLGATVSKTALCLVASLTVMWAFAGQTRPAPSRPARRRWWLAASVWLVVAVVFTLGSHVMVVRESAVPSMRVVELVAGNSLASFRWRGDSWVVMPTTYLFNKQASLQAISHSWPAGVGPAGQPAFTSALRRAGRYPITIGLVTPHSTYLKPVAELGAAGLAALLLILFAGSVAIKRMFEGTAHQRWQAAAFAGIGAAFLIEAIATDLLNCRHYWFVLAVMASASQRNQLERIPAAPRSKVPPG